jgi:hypothetical protein
MLNSEYWVYKAEFRIASMWASWDLLILFLLILLFSSRCLSIFFCVTFNMFGALVCSIRCTAFSICWFQITRTLFAAQYDSRTHPFCFCGIRGNALYWLNFAKQGVPSSNVGQYRDEQRFTEAGLRGGFWARQRQEDRGDDALPAVCWFTEAFLARFAYV